MWISPCRTLLRILNNDVWIASAELALAAPSIRVIAHKGYPTMNFITQYWLRRLVLLLGLGLRLIYIADFGTLWCSLICIWSLHFSLSNIQYRHQLPWCVHACMLLQEGWHHKLYSPTLCRAWPWWKRILCHFSTICCTQLWRGEVVHHHSWANACDLHHQRT